MKAILSIDKNWGIGYKNELLVRVPEDMRFFKEMTVGKVVVMGRKTFESLPGRKPLKDRINIVLGNSLEEGIEGIALCSTPEKLFNEIAKYCSDDVIIIGGASVYKLMLPYCSEVFITKFHITREADSFFPNLDNEVGWEPGVLREGMVWNDIEYSRVVYTNKNVKPINYP